MARAIAIAGRPNGENPCFKDLVFNLGPAPTAPATIGTDYPGVSAPLPFKEAKAQLLESFERAYVVSLIRRNNGNISQAAESAGLSRKHLYSLIQKTGIDLNEVK